jgi:hypothetical protein
MASKSVKIVASTPDAARAKANQRSTMRTQSAKDGSAAKIGGLVTEHFNTFGNKPKKTVVKIRTNPGISGKGGSNVGGIYKPMGGGMNWSTK